MDLDLPLDPHVGELWQSQGDVYVILCPPDHPHDPDTVLLPAETKIILKEVTVVDIPAYGHQAAHRLGWVIAYLPTGDLVTLSFRDLGVWMLLPAS